MPAPFDLSRWLSVRHFTGPLLACLLPCWALAATAPMPQQPTRMAHTAVHRLDDSAIRVRDLARLGAEERDDLGALVVAHVPHGTTSLELSAERRAALLRRRVPGHRLRLLIEGPVRFMVSPDTAWAGEDRRAGRECFALRQNLAAGAFVTQADLTQTACLPDSSARLPLRYDTAAGAPVTKADLAPGTYLGALTLRPQAPVAKGQTMALTVTEGPVQIERRVTALQSARSGRAIFVRTADGTVVSAPLALSRQEGTAQ